MTNAASPEETGLLQMEQPKGPSAHETHPGMSRVLFLLGLSPIQACPAP